MDAQIGGGNSMKIFKSIVLIILASAFIYGCERTDDSYNNGSNDASIEASTSDVNVGTFYYPDDIFNDYDTAEREFDGTPQGVVDILYELGNYGDNRIKVKGWHISNDVLYIDFDSSFIKATGSTAQEYFSVLGTVKTLKSCFGVAYVRLTVNSEDFNTEHGSYDRLM